MYQQSRRVLIFLIATFLPIQIIRGVIAALLSFGYVSGGKLPIYTQNLSTSGLRYEYQRSMSSPALVCVVITFLLLPCN